jgi:hypothetical protein
MKWGWGPVCTTLGGILINFLFLSERDQGFEPWSGKLKGVCVVSPLSAQHWGKTANITSESG